MKCALIDSDYLIYLVCHNKKDSDHIKSLDECKQQVDECISSIMLSTKATYYICFLTVGRGFRYDIYSEYKANRKKLEKPLYFTDIRNYIMEKYQAFCGDQLEADDLLNICYNEMIGKKDIEVTRVSPDKDILNLKGFNYNPNKPELGLILNSKEKADLYFWTSMITGDTSDNIKGIPGKGIKYAEKIARLNPENVLGEYMLFFGEELGIQEFYKNYMCLKIKDKWEGFVVPQPIEWKKSTEINAEFKE